MWITLAVGLPMALGMAVAPAGCAATGNSSTHPEGRRGCANSWQPPAAVRLGLAAPKIRVTLHVKCDAKVLATFMVRISIEHKDSLFADWYEVAHDSYFEPPGLANSYTVLAHLCRDGSYRAKASIAGTFINGEGYKVMEETGSASVNCERPQPVT
jgi:hypothetical protein